MTAFAMITADSDRLLAQVSRCASTLYHWLLRQRPAGKLFEADLEDFRTWTGTFRKKAYCFKWVRQAIDELTHLGLVEIERQYNSKIYKLAAHRAGNKTSQPENKTFQIENKTSQKRPANPDAVVDTYIENRETTNTFCSAADLKNSFFQDKVTGILEKFSEIEQVTKNTKLSKNRNEVTEITHKSVPKESIIPRQSVEKTIKKPDPIPDFGDRVLERPPQSPEPEHQCIAPADRPIDQAQQMEEEEREQPIKVVNQKAKEQLDLVDSLGIRLNPALVRLVKTTAAEIIEGAIAAYQRYRRDHYVKNPAGFFVYAVRNALENQHTNHQSNFFFWFEAMRKIGRLGYYEEKDGDYFVRDGQHFVSWQVLVERGWTCEYLQKRLRR
ncbi:hypothetical protein [Picosynechococcus sp. NKBG15041c]|uniref:hypothetical protein n=1 Tax=Picosynechococcus sp. NKBG15041c TaxID=1407650 RepID=UPI000409DCB8|nr:hypothetical protein [Picosynechococcus sp. NKBG15041c]